MLTREKIISFLLIFTQLYSKRGKRELLTSPRFLSFPFLFLKWSVLFLLYFYIIIFSYFTCNVNTRKIFIKFPSRIMFGNYNVLHLSQSTSNARLTILNRSTATCLNVFFLYFFIFLFMLQTGLSISSFILSHSLYSYIHIINPKNQPTTTNRAKCERE